MKGFTELLIVFLITAASLAPAQIPSQSTPHESISCSGGAVNANGIFAKLIDGRLYTSSDSHSWIERRLDVRTFLRDLTYADGRFVAVGGSYIGASAVLGAST